MTFLIQQTLLYAVPLMIVALAGVFAERSGIINLALEGIMIFGAFIGVLFVRSMQSVDVFANAARMGNFWTLQGLELLAMLMAAIMGAVFSLLLSFASINLKADQTIGGTALNLLATAIAVVIAKYFSDSGSAKLNYSNKPFLFSIGGLELSVFVPLGINLLKLESRPIPDRDFEFMFYFDLETSIYSEEFVRIISELDGLCEELHYLGSYLEVV